jgi:hypothetical protein
MTVPAADKLRRISGGSAVVDAAVIAADLLDAIDALHQPNRVRDWPNKVYFTDCLTCDTSWPCPTARLLHPEAGES